MKTTYLKTKLSFTVGIVMLLTITFIVYYSAYKSRTNAIQQTEEKLLLSAENYANTLKAKINETFEISHTLGNSFLISSQEGNLTRDVASKILKSTLVANKNFYGTCTLWEPNAFDGNDKNFVNAEAHDETGRFIPYWCRVGEEEYSFQALVGYETSGIGDYYLFPREKKKDVIIDPFYYPVNGVDVLMLSIVTPIILDDKFVGITGIDYSVDFFQSEAMRVKTEIFNNEIDITCISYNGFFAANTTNSELLGKNISDLFEDKTAEELLLIQKGKTKQWKENGILNICIPIVFGKTDTPWQIRFTIPEEVYLREVRNEMWFLIIVGTILLLLGVIIMYVLVYIFTKPLFELANITKKVARGYLNTSINVTTNDEIGMLAKSFSDMMDKIREIIYSITESAVNVTNGSAQISMSSSQIAEGANEQASASEEISSSIEEMMATINQNSENAQQTLLISQRAENGIIEGNALANENSKSMKLIAEKIMIINEIAAKTDLLAINAAVEAARAGEYGKGFAVVASEVRKLAEHTKNSANEIIELAEKSLQYAEKSSYTLNNIIPDVKRTSQLIQEITGASLEQNSNVSHISQAMQQLSIVIQENSATAEEMATGAEELASQSEMLKQTISFFKLKGADNKMEQIQQKLMKYIQEAFKNAETQEDFEEIVEKLEKKMPKQNGQNSQKEEDTEKKRGVSISLDNDEEYESFDNK